MNKKDDFNPAFVSNIPGIAAENDTELGAFLKKMCETVRKDRYLFIADGVPRVACPSWVRDHIHEMKGYRHWETDLKSFIDFLLAHQTEEGFFYEIVTNIDDGHATFVDKDCVLYDEKNKLVYIRLELEADVEYLIVEGAVRIYKATGDEKWIKWALPRLEKAIDYITSAPKRWDAERGLVKRTFTIDTWDFTYGYPATNRRISEGMPMSIMHGDNSGVYQAMEQLAWLNRRFGKVKKAEKWEKRAEKLLESINKYLWNGKFYTHQLHLNHEGAPGVDETKVLSLSNSYDMNRGICTQEQKDKIIGEYQLRRKTSGAFAEWFSVDPPYCPGFGDVTNRRHLAGTYINGGIASFTAGELARAALNCGHEEYGWDILCRLRELVKRDGDLYFLYHREKGTNEGGGPSGWGAAAVIEAIDEGLAGIVDKGVCFDELYFSPKWAVTGLKKVKYATGYEQSRTLVESIYIEEEDRVTITLGCTSKQIDCHILLPKGKKPSKVLLDGKKIGFETVSVRDSEYVDFSFFKGEEKKSYTEWVAQTKNRIEIVF